MTVTCRPSWVGLSFLTPRPAVDGGIGGMPADQEGFLGTILLFASKGMGLSLLTFGASISYRLVMIRYRSLRLTSAALCVACFMVIAGCRVAAPVHLWSPPGLQSTVGGSVLVPRIVGPKELAGPIHERLLQASPTDPGRQVRLVGSDNLNEAAQQRGTVALVSYNEDDESDLALVTTARQEKIDFIFRGEIMPDFRPRTIEEAGNRISISWRLMPVDEDPQSDRSGERLGRPIVVELDSALERYPDLKLATDKETVLQTALIRDTLPLIAPSVQRDRVQLEIPYLVPGSRTIRRGNALAVVGRWGQAEALWQEAYDRNPFSSVAVHNLAIAAVAKQDFASARKLSRKAVRMKPTKLHQSTSVWVERAQRAYHESFELPDPPEGWSVTREPEDRQQ